MPRAHDQASFLVPHPATWGVAGWVAFATVVALALAQPQNLALVSAALAVEQFGYGFGFTAYMVFMLRVAQGPHATAHYALCTGFMALGMMLPGMWSGALQDAIGYVPFFAWVLVATIPSLVMTALLCIPEGFGREEAA